MGDRMEGRKIRDFRDEEGSKGTETGWKEGRRTGA